MIKRKRSRDDSNIFLLVCLVQLHQAKVHRENFNALEVQQCTLLSIKTGGCTEDCKYCPQSSRYDTVVKAQKMLDTGEVLEAAQRAKEAGSTR